MNIQNMTCENNLMGYLKTIFCYLKQKYKKHI